MTKLTADEVFTPTTFPTHTYVERSQLALEQRLAPWLSSATTVAMVAGPSKAGKTVLIQKVVGDERLITVSGASITSADVLWDRVLDWLAEPTSTTATSTDTDTGTRALEGQAAGGVPGLATVQARGSRTEARATAEALGATVGRQGLAQVVRLIARTPYALLIDDFHYIAPEVQKQVAAHIKDAASRGVRIAVAAVPHRADQVVRALADLRGRAIAVDLEYWSVAELLRIAELGCARLGLVVDRASLEAFAVEAAGSPQLMQAICRWLCVHLKVDHTQAPAREITLTAEDRRAVLHLTSFMTDFRSLVRDLAKGPKMRGQDRNRYPFVAAPGDGAGPGGGEGDVYVAVLRALAADPPALTLDYDALTERIRRLVAGEPPPGASVAGACFHLGEIAKGFPGPSGTALEWDLADQVLTVPDPYLLFYLRWSEHLRRASQPAR